MWREAVARAGGPDRVVVRGVSLGTLAAALLIDDGARPAGVVLAAPVLGRTVSPHFARATHGAWGETLARVAFGPVTTPDLDEVLARTDVPVALWLLPGDELLPDDDRATLRRAAEAGGARVRIQERVTEDDEPDDLPLAEHVRATFSARAMLAGERAFLEEWLPDRPPRHERVWAFLCGVPPALLERCAPGTPSGELLATLAREDPGDDPRVAATLAAAGVGAAQARIALETTRRWGTSVLDDLDGDALAAMLDPADPDGPLPVGRVVACRNFQRASSLPPPASHGDLDVVVRWLAVRPDGSTTLALSVSLPDGWSVAHSWRSAGLWAAVSDNGRLPPEASRRRLMRVLLRAWGIPERVGRAPDGRPSCEALLGGAWGRVATERITVPDARSRAWSLPSPRGRDTDRGPAPSSARTPPAAPGAPRTRPHSTG